MIVPVELLPIGRQAQLAARGEIPEAVRPVRVSHARRWLSMTVTLTRDEGGMTQTFGLRSIVRDAADNAVLALERSGVRFSLEGSCETVSAAKRLGASSGDASSVAVR